MVTACSSPPAADFEDVFVPALIDVGILESLEAVGGIAPHHARWLASRPAPVLEVEALRAPPGSHRLLSAEDSRVGSLVKPSAFLR